MLRWLLPVGLLALAGATRLGSRRLIASIRARRLTASLLTTEASPPERQFDGHPVPSPATLLHPHTDFAHRYWSSLLKPGDTVIDATAGNGHDAAELAEALMRVGGGTLLCMDAQALALERSKERLRGVLAGWRLTEATPSEWVAAERASGGAELAVRWVEGCHAAALRELAPRSAALVVFNLGYLPGGDKAFTTTTATTIPAIEAAQRVVAVGGCVSATIYPGHPEGLDEEVAVLDHAANLTQGEWSVYHTVWLNQRNKRNGRRAPSLVLMQLLHE